VAHTTYSEEEHIASPVEAVYEYRLDYERNLPQYNPAVSKMQRTDDGTELGPGAVYEFEVDIPNMGPMSTSLTVLEADPPSRIVNEMGSGQIRAREECTFTPSGEGTLVRFDVTLTFPDEMGEGILQLAERSGREQVRGELDLMKKHLEA
jgi:uncharacterized protein YndB with AHSA1/START domain